ncbi:MAG TPA: glycosyltransferase, partial [Vicinamibacterales bacterium]|nr:glycosyltransferase [Vicinamibacterales bacterium]
IPLFDEKAVLPLLVQRLVEVLARLDCSAEIVLSDDGSRDRTVELVRQIAARDPPYRALSFSRNFGHQAAITAGLDVASGDAVVINLPTLDAEADRLALVRSFRSPDNA